MAVLTQRLPNGRTFEWPIRWHRNGTIVDDIGIALMEMPGYSFSRPSENLGQWSIHIQQAPAFSSPVSTRWLGWPAAERPEVVEAFFEARAVERCLTPCTTRAKTTRTRL